MVRPDAPIFNQNTNGLPASSGVVITDGSTLVAAPTQCEEGQYATGIDVEGNATCRYLPGWSRPGHISAHDQIALIGVGIPIGILLMAVVSFLAERARKRG